MATADLERNSDAVILSRVIAPDEPSLSPEAARGLLTLAFDKDDRQRMNELAEKARLGSLTEDECLDLDSYERVGHLLALLHSKARVSLKKAAQSS